MQEATSVDFISISVGWEKDQAIIALNNTGKNQEDVDIRYQESDSHSITKSFKYLKLPSGHEKILVLPQGFEKWNKLYFRVREKERYISNTSLRKLSDKVKRQIKKTSSQSKTPTSISKPEQTKGTKDLIDKAQTPRIETTYAHELPSIDYQQEAETTVQETNERVKELAHAYKNGEAIDFVAIENPTPCQNVLLILNWVASILKEWKNELEQSGKTDRNLIDTLTYREQDIKEKLKAIRSEKTPMPDPLESETDIYTDAELNEIRQECSYHVAWFEGRLFGCEERSKINNLEEYDQFIPQFIKDRLFNGVSRFVPFDQLPEQLEQCLQLVGYEVIPIEINKTQADARVHDIQGSRHTSGEPGTIVEVILPGLRRKIDGEIVQKPVVIRGE